MPFTSENKKGKEVEAKVDHVLVSNSQSTQDSPGHSAKHHLAVHAWEVAMRSCSTWRLNSNNFLNLNFKEQVQSSNWRLLDPIGRGLTRTSTYGECWVCMASSTSRAIIVNPDCKSECQVVNSSRGFNARYLWWRVQ